MRPCTVDLALHCETRALALAAHLNCCSICSMVSAFSSAASSGLTGKFVGRPSFHKYLHNPRAPHCSARAVLAFALHCCEAALAVPVYSARCFSGAGVQRGIIASVPPSCASRPGLSRLAFRVVYVVKGVGVCHCVLLWDRTMRRARCVAQSHWSPFVDGWSHTSLHGSAHCATLPTS